MLLHGCKDESATAADVLVVKTHENFNFRQAKIQACDSPLFGSDIRHHPEVEIGQVALGGPEKVSSVRIGVEKAWSGSRRADHNHVSYNERDGQ